MLGVHFADSLGPPGRCRQETGSPVDSLHIRLKRVNCLDDRISRGSRPPTEPQGLEYQRLSSHHPSLDFRLTGIEYAHLAKEVLA